MCTEYKRRVTNIKNRYTEEYKYSVLKEYHIQCIIHRGGKYLEEEATKLGITYEGLHTQLMKWRKEVA